jgi:hypothetical protein
MTNDIARIAAERDQALADLEDARAQAAAQARMARERELEARTLPQVLATVVVGPGDRLVLVFPAGTTAGTAARFRATLRELDMSDRVLIVAGIEELAVLRGSEVDSPARPGPGNEGAFPQVGGGAGGGEQSTQDGAGATDPVHDRLDGSSQPA